MVIRQQKEKKVPNKIKNILNIYYIASTLASEAREVGFMTEPILTP
jgi:hypothetical protein